MRALKWIGVVLGAYVGLVLAFEGLYLGWYQPKLENMPVPMLVITTTDDSGESRTRRLARLDADGSIYVSAHHWPRAWYRRAVHNPEVRVEIDGVESDFVAVPVTGEEFERVGAEYPLPLPIRFLMGFPPSREILRLDPATWHAATLQGAIEMAPLQLADIGALPLAVAVRVGLAQRRGQAGSCWLRRSWWGAPPSCGSSSSSPVMPPSHLGSSCPKR